MLVEKIGVMGGNLSNQGVKKMKKLTPIVGVLLFVLLITACAPTPANRTYDGYIFIQVIDFKEDNWENAGWTIENSQRNTDWLFENPNYPPGCTLYLLEYYDNIHIGYCIGTVENPVEIPIDGTNNQAWIVVDGVSFHSSPPTPAPSG